MKTQATILAALAYQARLEGGADDPVLLVASERGTERLNLTAADVARLRWTFGDDDQTWIGKRLELIQGADDRVRPIVGRSGVKAQATLFA